jgi:hypothetical protein
MVDMPLRVKIAVANFNRAGETERAHTGIIPEGPQFNMVTRQIKE